MTNKFQQVILMETVTSVDAKQFLERLTPVLACGNIQEALTLVQGHWSPAQLITLLCNSAPDARKVAALSLGLIGTKQAIGPLAVALHDDDAMVNQMAEHALWNIWFRLGNQRSVCAVKAGSCHLNHGNYVVAIEKFSQAIEADPTFAEAYNQRAIAHYLTEQFDLSIADCKSALSRIPQHFGAMAGMGHSYSCLKRWPEARHCYRLALAIDPRLSGIADALHQVQAIINKV
jgi:tetratricopeptide (TPR) repeat protein